MLRKELATNAAFARVRLGMSRTEFMRQTPREWAEIQEFLYDQLPDEVKDANPQNHLGAQSEDEMVAAFRKIQPNVR